MAQVAEVVRRHPRLLVISDEVYKYTVYAGKPHQLLLPFVQFCVATPMQQALSKVLTRADEPYTSQGRTCSSYYEWLTDTFRHKREVLAKGLERSGLVPMEGQGGFFLMADTSALNVPEEYMRHSTDAAPQMTRDWALCRWLAIEGE